MNDANTHPGRDTPPSLGSVVAAGLGFILIVGPLVAFIFYISKSHAQASMSLGALEVILALSSTLAGLIIVTQALGLAQPTSALGLPKGSVRALLAFSLVIIFVAVASWNLGGFLDTQATQGLSRETLTVPSTEEKAALNALQRQGVNGFVANRDDSAKTSTISYFVAANAESQKRIMDMAKDIMTIIATVLVTIVGFYFGSSSTVDGVNSAHATMRNVKAALLDGTGGTASGGPFAAADVSRTADATRAIADEMKTRLTSLGANPTGALKDSAAADQTLQPRLKDAEGALQTMKKASRAASAYADLAAATFMGITADTAQPDLNAAGEKVTGLQDEAKKSKDDFDRAYATFLTATGAKSG